jgi:hypothetical protein
MRKTCGKLGISFYSYLGGHLQFPDVIIAPARPDPVRQNAAA